MATSPRVAKVASKQLQSPKSSPKVKEVAGSALSDVKKGSKSKGK